MLWAFIIQYYSLKFPPNFIIIILDKVILFSYINVPCVGCLEVVSIIFTIINNVATSIFLCIVSFFPLVYISTTLKGINFSKALDSCWENIFFKKAVVHH